MTGAETETLRTSSRRHPVLVLPTPLAPRWLVQLQSQHPTISHHSSLQPSTGLGSLPLPGSRISGTCQENMCQAITNSAEGMHLPSRFSIQLQMQLHLFKAVLILLVEGLNMTPARFSHVAISISALEPFQHMSLITGLR